MALGGGRMVLTGGVALIDVSTLAGLRSRSDPVMVQS
jgi:hypothetical protein